jgi:hypothetical protein
MLYTFTNAGTPVQLSADVAELKAALPRGAVVGSLPLLTGPPPGPQPVPLPLTRPDARHRRPVDQPLAAPG